MLFIKQQAGRAVSLWVSVLTKLFFFPLGV